MVHSWRFLLQNLTNLQYCRIHIENKITVIIIYPLFNQEVPIKILELTFQRVQGKTTARKISQDHFTYEKCNKNAKKEVIREEKHTGHTNKIQTTFHLRSKIGNMVPSEQIVIDLKVFSKKRVLLSSRCFVTCSMSGELRVDHE